MATTELLILELGLLLPYCTQTDAFMKRMHVSVQLRDLSGES